MQVVLIILSLGLLGVIIYFAVSPKSSRLLKLSALIALGVIGLSIAICVIFLIKGPSQDPAAISLPVFQDTPTAPAKKGNVPAVLFFVAVLLGIVGLIVIAVRREKKTDTGETVKKSTAEELFQDDDGVLDMTFKDESEKKDHDDNFDIDI